LPADTWPWSALGLAAMPGDARDIRRGYARALKQIDQAKDISGFEALRAAYQSALDLFEDAGGEGRAEARPPPRPSPRPAGPLVPDPIAQAREVGSPDKPPPGLQAAPLALTLDLVAAEPPAQDPRPAAAEALFRLIRDPGPELSADARYLQVLAHPLAEDPDYKGAIRTAIARRISLGLRDNDLGETALEPGTSQESLAALNKDYHWLDDLRAFRADFGQNEPLLALMIGQLYSEQDLKPRLPPIRPKTRWGRFEAALGPFGPFLAWAAFFGTFTSIGALEHSPYQCIPILILTGLAILVIAQVMWNLTRMLCTKLVRLWKWAARLRLRH
jgi:hypothetical protein